MTSDIAVLKPALYFIVWVEKYVRNAVGGIVLAILPTFQKIINIKYITTMAKTFNRNGHIFKSNIWIKEWNDIAKQFLAQRGHSFFSGQILKESSFNDYYYVDILYVSDDNNEFTSGNQFHKFLAKNNLLLSQHRRI